MPTSGARERGSMAARSPSSPWPGGICTSNKATSGRWARALRRKSSASPAWPATSNPPSVSMRAIPSRRSTSSSPMTTRTGASTTGGYPYLRGGSSGVRYRGGGAFSWRSASQTEIRIRFPGRGVRRESLMDLPHLRYFVAVAEELPFRRAAERLHVAQPAVSEQIRKLEQELGVQLLNRTHRSVSLTPAGAAMLDEGRRCLRQADVAQQAARDADRRGGHKLRVGCVADAFPHKRARALARIGTVMPSVDLALETSPASELIEDVRAGRLDVAAVCLPARVHGLRPVPFTREGTVAAVPVMHRLADGESIGI